MKHENRTRISALLLALLLLAGSAYAAPVKAADTPETEYIVKYKERAAWRRKDPRIPFDVVSETEMRRLWDAGLLEWYEPDGVMELIDCHSEEQRDEESICDGKEILRFAQNDMRQLIYADGKWDLAMIHADAAFAQNALGQGVRVGVVDSGINHHPALNSSLLSGSNYTDGADAGETADSYGHGTLVAGLIAGEDETGCLGAAPGVELVPLKITDGKAITVSTVCRAIYGGIDDYGCDVLNLSLGIRTDYQALREAVEYAEQQGVVIVAAVGNNGNAGLYYPAVYETVIGVGAVDETGEVYYHSNQNASVFLTAPGANVKTTGKLGGYTNASGTSFAVPHVTAAAAVLRGIDPDLTPNAIRELLSQTATDRGAPGWDKAYGWGIVNIGESVLALTNAKADPSYTVPEGLVAMVGWTLADVELPSGWTWNDPTQVIEEAGAQTFPATFTPENTENYNVVENVALTVTAKTMKFVDVLVGSYYFDAACWAVLHDVTAGTSETTFTPSGDATRAQVVTFLWRMAGSPEPAADGAPVQNQFKDVEDNAYCCKAVLWAAENGITVGTSATTFSPNDSCTREQAVSFLWRMAGMPEPETCECAFEDVKSDGYACKAILWAAENGITAGTSATAFCPKSSCTRAQIVTFLWRYAGKN